MNCWVYSFVNSNGIIGSGTVFKRKISYDLTMPTIETPYTPLGTS
jgi:hypothetical protein